MRGIEGILVNCAFAAAEDASWSFPHRNFNGQLINLDCCLLGGLSLPETF